MYEIWLAMNIVYEIALGGGWLLPVLVIAVWAGLMWAVRRRLDARVLRRTLGLGAAVALALFLALPSLTRSSLSNLAYLPDWAMLAAMALGLAALLAVLGLPLLALLARPAPAPVGA